GCARLRCFFSFFPCAERDTDGRRRGCYHQQRRRESANHMSESTEATTTGTSPEKPRLREKSRLMSASEIERTLVRLAHEIVEKNDGCANLGLIGIKRRGVPLAERLGKLIAGIEKQPVQTGVLDINLYRDDLTTTGPRPTVIEGEIGFDVTGRDIVLMDDVLYTGRT